MNQSKNKANSYSSRKAPTNTIDFPFASDRLRIRCQIFEPIMQPLLIATQDVRNINKYKCSSMHTAVNRDVILWLLFQKKTEHSKVFRISPRQNRRITSLPTLHDKCNFFLPENCLGQTYTNEGIHWASFFASPTTALTDDGAHELRDRYPWREIQPLRNTLDF